MRAELHYVLHEELGAGGMGVVYLGTLVSPAGERRVAIKQLAPHGRIHAGERDRLIAEARLVFRLTHTNICQVLDLGENDRGTFVVMEYVAGLDLRALLDQLGAQERRLDAASAIHIGREIARALDYAHRRTDETGAPLGLVHGDVTPQNVLLSVEGEVKLADFGIARALRAAAPGMGLRAGTPGFVAPEVAAGEAADHRADLYSLGVALAVALLGEQPQAALACLPRLGGLAPGASGELGAILLRATAREPQERFVSAGELERALSFELARRHPAFTPQVLARVVRAAGRRHRTASTATVPARAEPAVLQSLTRTADAPLGAAVEAPPAAAPPLPEGRAAFGTVTVGVRQRSRAVLGGLAALFALGGALGAAALRHRGAVGERAAEPASSAPAPAPAAREPGPPPLPTPAAALASLRNLPQQAATPTGARPPRSPGGHVRRGPRPHAVAPVDPAYLTVNASPWGAVYVDGRRVAGETPLYRFRLPPGEHVVEVQFADGGGRSRPERIRLASGELRTLGFLR